MKRLGISRWDAVVIAAVFLISIIGFFITFWVGRGAATEVVARYPGGEERLPLAVDASITIETDAGALMLEVETGEARVLQADCPDKLCVSAGPLSRAGDTAVCLPLGIIITVEGGLEGGADDAISW